MLRHELFKYRHALLILCVVTVLLVLWMYVDPLMVAGRASRTSPVDAELLRSQMAVVQPAFSFNYGLSTLAAMGPFLMAFVGAYVIGSEFRWRTLGGQSARLRRKDIINAKLAVLAVIGLVIVLGVISLSLLASLAVSSYLQHTMPAVLTSTASSDLWLRLPIQLVVVWTSLMLWGTIAFLCAVVLHSTALGFIVAMTWAYLEWLVGPLLGAVQLWLPTANQSAGLQVFDYVYGAGIIGPTSMALTIPLHQSIILTLIYVFLGWRASVVIFHRLEIAG